MRQNLSNLPLSCTTISLAAIVIKILLEFKIFNSISAYDNF